MRAEPRHSSTNESGPDWIKWNLTFNFPEGHPATAPRSALDICGGRHQDSPDGQADLANVGHSRAAHAIQEGQWARVELSHWSRSLRYCALIGWALLCWCQGLCHNNTPQGGILCMLLWHDKWLPCIERIYYRQPYAIKTQWTKSVFKA